MFLLIKFKELEKDCVELLNVFLNTAVSLAKLDDNDDVILLIDAVVFIITPVKSPATEDDKDDV